MFRPLLFLLFFALPLAADVAGILAPLLDPAKIETLKGERPVNARFYRVLGWLQEAKERGEDVSAVIDAAQVQAGYGGTPRAAADKWAILWSRTKMEAWGCFPEGIAELKKGNSPTIRRGEHAGQAVNLDHVLPVAIVPELAARFFNLEAITADENRRKGARITGREIALARRWNRAGLLSGEGLKAVEAAAGN